MFNCNTAEDFASHVRNGEKISAIKTLRTMLNLGLKEAKDMIETLPQFRAVGVPLVSAPVQEQSAHYVVCYRSGGEDYVHNFRDDYDNRDQAMEMARAKMEYVSDSGDIVVAKVIATTKRTLVTL